MLIEDISQNISDYKFFNRALKILAVIAAVIVAVAGVLFGLRCHIAAQQELPVEDMETYIAPPDWNRQTEWFEQERYRSHLGESSVKIYDTMEKAARSLQTTVIFDGVTENELIRAYRYMLLDNPDIFWADGSFEYILDVNGNVAVVFPSYSSHDAIALAQQHDSYIQRIKETVDSARKEAKKQSDSKAFFSSHYLLPYVREQLSPDLTGSSTIEAFMSDGENPANDMAYAKAIKFIYDAAGIDCVIIYGDSKCEKSENHAWNMFRFDGTVYYVDGLWDDEGKRPIHARYTSIGYEFESAHRTLGLARELPIFIKGSEQSDARIEIAKRYPNEHGMGRPVRRDANPNDFLEL